MLKSGNQLIKMLDEKLLDLERIISEIDMDDVVRREIMTTKEFASYSKLSFEKISELKTQKKIPYYEALDRVYFYKEDIDNWMKSDEYISLLKQSTREAG